MIVADTFLLFFTLAAVLTVLLFCLMTDGRCTETFYEDQSLRKWLPLFATDAERQGCYYEMLPDETECVRNGQIKPSSNPKHNVTQEPGLPVGNCVYSTCAYVAEDCEVTWPQDCTLPMGQTCGPGTKTATVTRPPAHGGQACPEPKVCNVDCPVDCKFTWPDKCTFAEGQTCGAGTMSPIVTTPDAHGGQACPAPRSCSLECPVNCVFTWPDKCTFAAGYTCGAGTMSPIVTTPAVHGGKACPEMKSCSLDCPVDCEFTWPTECPFAAGQTCGASKMSPIVSRQPAYGGKACPDPQDCKKDCPVNCQFTWPDTCTLPAGQTCGAGTQSPVVVKEAANGGQACPALKPCNVECPTNCQFTWPEGCFNNGKKCGPQTSDNRCWQNTVDYMFNDIFEEAVASKEECADRCDKGQDRRKGCIAVVYSPSLGRCWYKNKLANFRNHSDRDILVMDDWRKLKQTQK